MTLPTFQRGIPGAPITCPRCTILQMMVDCETGLCVECWRVAVLAPAALYLAACDHEMQLSAESHRLLQEGLVSSAEGLVSSAEDSTTVITTSNFDLETGAPPTPAHALPHERTPGGG